MNINEVNKKVLDEYGVEFNIEDWIGKSKGCFKILVNEDMKVEYVDRCDLVLMMKCLKKRIEKSVVYLLK